MPWLLYATYTGLVYLTPLLGGYLADKFLGQRKAILVGGIVMALGPFRDGVRVDCSTSRSAC